MQESLNSPNIHNPANLAEYANTIMHYPDSLLWAFGSSIMNKSDYYPNNKTNVEIIYLGGIDELYKFQRNDRAAEFGSMVNLNEILTSGKSVLPPILISTLSSIATPSVRNRISVGGVLANNTFHSALIGTLYILDSLIEIRYTKKKHIHYHFFPLAKLFNETGLLALPKGSLISRLRIGIHNYSFQYFKQIDSPVINPEKAVAISFVTNFEQISTINARLAITFADKGLYVSRDVDQVLSNIHLPISINTIIDLSNKIVGLISSDFNITPIQIYRTKMLIYSMLNAMNYSILTQTNEQ